MARLPMLVSLLAACSSPSNVPADLQQPGDGGVADLATTGGADLTGVVSTGKWVTGYHVGYQDALYPAAQIDFAGMTHLVVGRLIPNADGTLTTTFDSFSATAGPVWAKDLATRTHQAGKLAILMLGGAGEHDKFVTASNATNRATFVANLVQFAQANGFDGLDLDWEPLPAADEASFSALASALRQAWPAVILTVPVGNVNINTDTVSSFWATGSALFDQINIMSYGMGDNYGPGWQSWHSSPIHGETANTPVSIDSTVAAYLKAGVPAAKLGIGIGFYGTCWNAPVTAPRQSPGAAHVIASDNTMSYTNIMANYHTAAAFHYDAVAQAPYLSFVSSAKNPACTFISYDDPQSIADKGAYVKSKNLGGAIIWTIGQGYPLLAATRQAFLQ